MREGWEYKKLGELVQVLNGYAFKSSLYENQGIRVLRITNVQKGNIVDDDPKYYPLSLTDEIRNYLLKESDLLMSLTGNVGRVGLLTKEMLPAALNQRVACLRILSNGLNLGFLFHYLNSDKFEQDAVLSAKGIAQKNMSTEWLKDYKLPLPPISVQQSIVSELDKINELIRLKKEQLKDYDNLAQSIFYEMFGDPVENEKGWEERTMQDLCVNIVDCPHSTPKKVDYITDYPCIRTSELRGGSISWATMQYLDEDEYNIRIARLKPEAGDIVFGREGTIGDAVILPLGYNFSLGQRTMLLRADTSIVSNIFLHRIILSDWIKHQIEYVNVSSTVAHVNIRDFKKFTVPLPPLQLQQLFAQRIELIEQQKAEIQSTISDLETLLASRMQYWFE